MDLPTAHRIPLSWLLQHGNETAELSLPPDLPENAVLVKTIRD